VPECTDNERKMLDNLHKADVVFLYFDEDHSTLSWMKAFTSRPPATYECDYGHIDGERVVRRMKVTLGLNAKQFGDAVRRGKEREAA
jgi:hypothetical protein